ncbi:MAG TPA: ATP-binding protein [Planctomycetota bacterium]|nr:ATP-binding protein [Planctomycetota bacterium]
MGLGSDEFSALLDNLEAGVALLDEEGLFRYANRAVGTICGCDAAALVGRPALEALPAPRGEIDWKHAARNAIQRGRSVRLTRFAFPGRVLDCALAPIRLGDATLALLTVTDVSEAVRLEERLLRQARTQAIANLGDSVAHEIRNPLNSIHMNVQLLREGLHAPALDLERLDRTAGTVQREIKRLDGVVRDFVQFSRPPALRLDRGSVNHVVRAALDSLDAQIREKKLRVRTDLQSARPVNMDRDRIQRAIYNVLLNAVQVVPEGGEITCRSRDEEIHCILEISDNGPGLDPAKSMNIFNLFYTTKPGGTGLGLPIANRIVEEHGGRMAVASAPGEGATFAFFLPYEGPPPERAQGPTAVPAAKGERGRP